MLILAWFAPLIVKIVKKMVPETESDEEFRLKYINVGTVSTSELSLVQAKNEITLFAERVYKMFGFLKELFVEEKEKRNAKLFARIEKYEDISDKMEVEIANYLTQISQSQLSDLSSRRIRAMFEIIDDIESISDSCYNLAKIITRKKEKKVVFLEDITNNLQELFLMIDSAFEIMIANLGGDYVHVNSNSAQETENKINNYRNVLREQHLINVKEKKYKYTAGVIYSEIFSASEKLADYIINVSESIEDVKH